MPLAGYHLIGFEKGPVSFNDRDFRLLQQPEHRERTKSFFSRSPRRYNLIFHNGFVLRHPNHHGDVDELTNQWLLHGRIGGPTKWGLAWTRQQHLDKFLAGRTDLIDPTAVNFVYMSNATGIPIIPLTPHMMAHRMGHIHMLIREESALYGTLIRWADAILEKVYGHQADPGDLYAWGEKAPHDAICRNMVLKALCTTRAGRTGNVMGWEYVPEWMAQWINKGHIIPGDLPKHVELHKFYWKEEKLRQRPNAYGELTACGEFPTRDFAHEIARHYNRVMDKWIGEVIIT